MEDHFKENALSWGEAGAEWLNTIPSLIKKYEDQWSLVAQAPFPLSYNYVTPVKQQDGSLAVLKIGFPGDREFKSEMAALEVFKGDGAVRLLKADHEDCVILLEHCLPGDPLSTLDDDAKATKIIAGVLKKLHKPLPEQHSFISINDWSEEISKYLQRFDDTDGPLPLSLVTKAEKQFKYLISTSAPAVLVHGDLHHDNVLHSDEHGWIAIDPKGLAAEPLYEVAAMIRNPYEKLKDMADLEPLLKQRISILSKELQADPQRILDWCFAQTVLSAVWSVDGVRTPDHAIRLAQALDTMTV